MSDTSMKNTESWKKLTKEYSMTRNLNADPRLLGGPTVLCPCPQNNSSQRMAMFASNITQAMIPDGAEFPLIASGFERQFMDYTFNTTRLKQNATTVAVIPKYRPNVGKSPIYFNPSFIIVYIGESDNLVHYMDVPRYTKGTDGFGYENIINETFLRAGVGIPANTPICHSKAVQGSKYCLGVNANVAYMTMKETVEDAFCMSESLAERMGSTGIKTQIINIDKNMVPLNLYGTADDYKFMPDLHEEVRDDGILCAFRHVDEASMISDMTDQALMYPNTCHDEVFYTEPGAVIIDIDVYRNPNRQVKTPATIFTQVDKYIENALVFHTNVIQVYERECIKNGRKPAPEFASLVDRAVQVLGANKQKYLGLKSTPKFSYKGEVIRYIQLIVTYKYKNKVTKGSKSTGREGSLRIMNFYCYSF